MRIITRRRLLQFWEEVPAARLPLQEWHAKARAAQWTNFLAVKQTFGQTDQTKVGSGASVAIFDIGGNKFRLIAAIHFNTGKIFVLRIMAHKEYALGKWKDQL
jgi:mRNA interferase HigB